MLLFVLRSAVVFALAFAGTALLRRRSASERHLVWLAAFVAVATLPLFASGPSLVQVTPPPAAARVLAPVLPEVVKGAEPTPAPIEAVAEVIAPPTYPAPTPTPAPYITLAGLYWIGFALCLSRLLFGGHRLRLALRHSHVVRSFEGAIQIREVRKGYLGSPATFGWPRAAILLPEESAHWPEARREIAIAHEIAHIERADWLWQCLALAICAVQWFNPLAWLAAARLRAEAEAAADDAVLRRGLAPSHYAQELLTLAEGLRRDATLAVPIARPGGVAARVRAILAHDRDRRPTTRPTRWAAGTGTFFLTAFVGGVGVSAVVANVPPLQTNPFQYQPQGAFGQMHSFEDVAGSSLGVQLVQYRPQGGNYQAWDAMGRSMMPIMQGTAPRASDIPGRKIREIAITCPPLQNLDVELPKEATLIYVIRNRHSALVAAAFPEDAQVTPIRLAVRTAPGTVLRHESLRPVTGPRGRRVWPGIRWFAVPRSSQAARYLPIDDAGQPIPVVAQFDPHPGSEILIAVEAARASQVRQIQVRTLVADWRTYGNLLLDPAPPVAVRANAPVAKVPLAGGGQASVARIEAVTPGMPYRAWAIDGGAPPPNASSMRGYGGVWEPWREKRQVQVHLRWPRPLANSPSVTWKLDKPLDYQGGGSSASSPVVTTIAEVQFSMPTDHPSARLLMGYAYEPWRVCVEERLGGSRIKANAKLDPNYMVNDEPVMRVRYTPPTEFREMDMTLEALDARGKPLQMFDSSGPATVNGKLDPERAATFRAKSPSQIARLRLKVRPMYWVTLPSVPLQPR